MMYRVTSPLFLLQCLTILALWRFIVKTEAASPPKKFKAAVYSHALIAPPSSNSTVVSRTQALAYMEKNLVVYRNQAIEAKRLGADILVFPEDGIYGYIFTRETIYPYLEYIPDPQVEVWSPCNDPDRYPNSEVQQTLSCIAKNNSLYLVANMGDKQPCSPAQDPKCPQDGRYQFNTDITFGPDGTLLARYHKYHLYYEYQFDTPEAEIITFDTPFGKFGMMVCFDVLFYEPGVPMVLSKNITNIVFPTAWMDALPLLSAIGFHSSFARGLGINFLSANLHIPESRFHGSGIYAPDGMKAFHYGVYNSDPPALLVAELDVLEMPKPNADFCALGNHSQAPQAICNKAEKNAEADDNLQTDEFYARLYHDKFTFRTLDQANASLRVCQKEVCCDLQYTIDESEFGKELFAFGAFDGNHDGYWQYYFQTCALVKCANASDKMSCGRYTETSTTIFQMIKIQGEMPTPFMYPQVVLSNDRKELQLATAEAWDFKDGALWTKTLLDKPLVLAALVGRDYRRDKCVVDAANEPIGPEKHAGGENVATPQMYHRTAVLAFSALLTIVIVFLFY